MENIVTQNECSERKHNRSGKGKRFRRKSQHGCGSICIEGTLASASINVEYIIKAIKIDCNKMKEFLFTLGCYEGEAISVISIFSNQYVVVVKDARYSIDKNLASRIIISE